MADDLQELVGKDTLLPPPANPLAPPAAVGEAISSFVNPPYAEANRARRSQPGIDLQDRMRKAAEHSWEFMKVPGQTLSGELETKPETPGQWSETDEQRAKAVEKRQLDWGIQTGFGTVMDPVPALTARLAAPSGSYALRNLRAEGKLTPVENDPFAAGAPEVALGVFAGPSAKTANMAKLDQAKQLLASGRDPETIWKDTGWFQGADKMWRFEINDAPAKFNPGAHKQVRPMSEVVDHPELYDAYPNLRDIKTETFSASGQGFHQPPTSSNAPRSEQIRVPTGDTVYDPMVLKDGRVWNPFGDNSPNSSRNVALHELQHAIQTREGFATGGDPKDMIPFVRKEFDKITDPHVYQDMQDRIQEVAHEAYMRLAGETEARNVTARSRGSSRPPWETEDRPREVQTVRDVRRFAWPNKIVPVDYDPFK